MLLHDLVHATKTAVRAGTADFLEASRRRRLQALRPVTAERVMKYLTDRKVDYKVGEQGDFLAELDSGRKVQIGLTGDEGGCLLVRVFWDSTVEQPYHKDLAVALNDTNAGLVFPKVYAVTVEADDGVQALTVVTECATDFAGVGASDAQLEFALDNSLNQAEGFFDRFRVELTPSDEPPTGQYL